MQRVRRSARSVRANRRALMRTGSGKPRHLCGILPNRRGSARPTSPAIVATPAPCSRAGRTGLQARAHARAARWAGRRAQPERRARARRSADAMLFLPCRSSRCKKDLIEKGEQSADETPGAVRAHHERLIGTKPRSGTDSPRGTRSGAVQQWAEGLLACGPIMGLPETFESVRSSIVAFISPSELQ